MTTRLELLTLVSGELDVQMERLTPEATLVELEIESLDAITVLFAVEDKYDVKIDESFLEHAKTLGDVLDALIEQIGTDDESY